MFPVIYKMFLNFKVKTELQIVCDSKLYILTLIYEI